MARRLASLCALALPVWIAGCVAGSSPGVSTARTTTTTSADVLPSGLPIDPSVQAISASHPSSDVAAALAACTGSFSSVGPNDVAGAGFIPHARDVLRYAPLTGAEPELQRDDPAWVVQFRGDRTLPLRGQIATDPVCVVVAGEPYVFLPNGYRYQDGPVFTPLPDRVQPSFALPSPAP